jgi:hypothetical protein
MELTSLIPPVLQGLTFRLRPSPSGSSASCQIRALDPGELIARQPGLTEHVQDEAVFSRTPLDIVGNCAASCFFSAA